MATYECFKCCGAGSVPFKHIENGVCFTCGGSGQLSYQPKQKAWTDPHPEWLVPVENRPTQKQWDYLGKLCGDSDTKFCEIARKAGAPSATARYMTRAMMSKAIELAKAGA